MSSRWGLGSAAWAIASYVYPLGLVGVLVGGAAQAQPVKALPLDAASCANSAAPPPALRGDYERAAAKAPPTALVKQARDEQLRSNLAAAERLLSGAEPATLTADGKYTLGRIREACAKPRAALRQYREVLWDAKAPAGTVELAREGLRRLGQPDTAAARDPGEKPLSADEAHKAYREALGKGRSAADGKQRAVAQAAFLDAIGYAYRARHAKNDIKLSLAAPFSELGLLALQEKDLQQAEELTQWSLRVDYDPQVEAASLYNLGLIFEAKGDKLAAATAYRRSLELRPSATVRKQLSLAEPGAGEPATVPRPLLGPFASPADYCKKVAKTICGNHIAHDRDDDEFLCKADAPLGTLSKPAGPYQAVQVFETGCDNFHAKYTTHDYHLAIQTAAGWFVSSALTELTEGHKCGGSAKPLELVLRDVVPGGAPEVLLRLETTSECISAPVVTTTEKTTWLVLAGLGASNKPSATAGIPVATATSQEELDDDKKVTQRGKSQIKCQANFAPAGELTLSCAPGAVPAGLGDLLGTHTLRFP